MNFEVPVMVVFDAAGERVISNGWISRGDVIWLVVIAKLWYYTVEPTSLWG